MPLRLEISTEVKFRTTEWKVGQLVRLRGKQTAVLFVLLVGRESMLGNTSLVGGLGVPGCTKLTIVLLEARNAAEGRLQSATRLVRVRDRDSLGHMLNKAKLEVAAVLASGEVPANRVLHIRDGNLQLPLLETVRPRCPPFSL